MTEKVTHVDNYKVIEYEKTNIFLIENILDDDFCLKYRNIIDKIRLNKDVYGSGNNVECYSNYFNNIKENDYKYYYSFPLEDVEYNSMITKLKQKGVSVSTNHLNGICKSDIESYISEINTKMECIGNIMKNINSYIHFNCNSGYILRKIYGKTRAHQDGLNQIHDSNVTFIRENKKGEYKMIRNASIVFSLNDDYEGGNFKFPYYDVSIRLKKGSVIIFPPFWTHTHETDDLMNNTFRYTITTWTCDSII
jgi:hypothetical protein